MQKWQWYLCTVEQLAMAHSKDKEALKEHLDTLKKNSEAAQAPCALASILQSVLLDTLLGVIDWSVVTRADWSALCSMFIRSHVQNTHQIIHWSRGLPTGLEPRRPV